MSRLWTVAEERRLAAHDGRTPIDKLVTLFPHRGRVQILRKLLSLRPKKTPGQYQNLKMPPLVAAYTAGFVDGEGSIAINTVRNKKGTAYFKLAIQISSTSFETVDALRTAWSGLGSITIVNRKQPRWHKTAVTWAISGIEGERFLTLIEPYLIMKKEHAHVALQFRKYVTHGVPTPLTKTALKARQRLATRLRDLNSKTRKGLECQVKGSR